MTVPYTIEYQGELALIAEHLRAAAQATTQPTLARLPRARADALVSNDYYASDVAWMELDASIEPTIGPYEVYEDEWFAAKAAFEAFITLRDDAETAKLTKFSAQLQGLENRLPIDPAMRNPKLGALSPIRVVNVVFSAGDGNRGVQTAAFNLPNDERVVQEKGTKRTMLKNTQEAKFRLVLQPIAKQALSAADQGRVQFDAFFTHILMHELMHGLGPNSVTVNGQTTTVRALLKETYSTLEEAKADISGLWALQTLVDDGVIDKSLGDTMYVTFLASAFRSIRFGTIEAHGRGIAIQLNALLDAGAFVANADGTFRVEPTKIRDAVKALTTEIMMVQARGDYAGAKALMARATIRPEVQAARSARRRACRYRAAVHDGRSPDAVALSQAESCPRVVSMPHRRGRRVPSCSPPPIGASRTSSRRTSTSSSVASTPGCIRGPPRPGRGGTSTMRTLCRS